jgi:hypothetical protein
MRDVIALNDGDGLLQPEAELANNMLPIGVVLAVVSIEAFDPIQAVPRRQRIKVCYT